MTVLRRLVARTPTAWRRAVVLAVVLRLTIAFASVVFGGFVETAPPEDVDRVRAGGFEGWQAPTPEDQGWGLVGAGLERYDALWYLGIARDGYPQPSELDPDTPSAYAFFPMYPLLVGITGRLVLGNLLLAANLVSLVATAAALAGVHRLIETETGDRALADRAALVTAVFPASFFLVAPYTESTFLALSGWALVLARRRRWAGAGALGVFAGLTRGVGVLLSVAFLVEAWRQHREGRRFRVAQLGALAGPPIGLGSYLLFCAVRTGEPLAPLLVQDVWDRQLTAPTSTMLMAVRSGVRWIGDFPGGYHTLDLVLFLVVAAGLVWLVVRAPATYWLYGLAHALVWLVTPFPGRPLMSTYRFALAVAPLAWAFAAWTARPGAMRAWCAISGVFAGAMLLAFVNWYFVL